MLIPLTIIFVILFVVPFIVLLYYSFLTYKSGQVIPTTPYTLGAYAKFFSDSFYPRVVGRTIVISLVTALICSVLDIRLHILFQKVKGI